jgi:hypothetical protein
MPKHTRDSQFQAAFTTFMASFAETYYPNLSKWEIKNTTENRASALHTYQLKIPKQVVLCEIKRPASDPPVEVMMTDQETPVTSVFVREFKAFFDPFELEEHGRVVSYTSITECGYQLQGESVDVANLDFVGKIDVCYYKAYIPYPSDLQTHAQLMEQCKQLRIANVNLKYDIDHMFHGFQAKSRKLYQTKKLLRKIEAETNEKLGNTIDRMGEKIRELYKALGESVQEECPVCYEVMSSEDIAIPGCCHYICTKCSMLCNKCPLCREEYI